MTAHPWQDLEFRHLDYAIAVKQHQSFLKASLALGLDQGFLSRQIQRLETRLGCQLFDRTTRPLGLTAAGQSFLTNAEQILAQTQRAVTLAREIEAGQRGSLHLGINTSIANSDLSRLVQTFGRQYPHVHIKLYELASYDQIEQLKRWQIEVGIFHRHNLDSLPPEDMAALEVTPILSEPLVVVLPDTHPATRQDRISLASLNGECFVLPPPTVLQGLRGQIDRLLVRAGCTPTLVQEAAWITTVLSLVAGGTGISLLPANVTQLRRAGVIYRPLEDDSPLLHLVAVSAAGNPSAPLRNFLQVIRTHSASG